MTVIAVIVLLAAVLPWLIFDAIAGVRAAKYSDDVPEYNQSWEEFQVLVPIYGNVKYLENVQYLLSYGSRVILCTSSGQTAKFYTELHEIAVRYGLAVYQSPYEPPTVTRKRSTGGATRDNVIKDALNDAVTADYVVCIDADTTTAQSLDYLVGELRHQGQDLSSIRLVPQSKGGLLVQLQRHEYRLAMRLRYLFPWLVSGACHVARTSVLRDIMNRHSMFFQGNDVETGLIGEQRGYKVGHIPFEVNTSVPDTLSGWWRQRLAWSGGEFRLFIVNIRYILKHPFLWVYGAVIVIVLFVGRWYMAVHPSWAILVAFVLYCLTIYALHWRTRDRWLLALPLYTLITSFVIVPLGIVKYVQMIDEGNFGVIRPDRTVTL